MDGCYGSAFCNSLKNDCCKSCTLFLKCQELAIESARACANSYQLRRLELEQVSLGIVKAKTTKSVKRFALSEAQLKIVDNEKFPNKARILARSIFSKGLNSTIIMEMMSKNVNPFLNHGSKIVIVACHILMKKGYLQKESLTQYFSKTLNLQRKSAVSSAQTVLIAFTLVGIIVADSDEKFILRKR